MNAKFAKFFVASLFVSVAGSTPQALTWLRKGPMKRIVILAVAAVGFSALATTANAADPTGTWSWSVLDKRERILKLKLERDGLTGAMIEGTPERETLIQNAKFIDGQISFRVPQTLGNGRRVTMKYSGKLDGDTIKGKVEVPDRDGEITSHKWEAYRQK